MAYALLDWETIDKYQIDELMQGKKLAPPEPEPEPEVFEAAIDLDDDQQGQSISQEPVLTS
jgi:cell division protease FtsH